MIAKRGAKERITSSRQVARLLQNGGGFVKEGVDDEGVDRSG